MRRSERRVGWSHSAAERRGGRCGSRRRWCVHPTSHRTIDNVTANLLLSDAKEEATVDTEGGLKRCGGQGDILSGAVGAFLAWGKNVESGAWDVDGSVHFAYHHILGS